MPAAIFEDGPVDTPYVYTVTGTGDVTPRACAAVYDGTGAGGSFVPAVIYRSQAGNVIARAILESTIAAGASAEVSWFPGVKVAAAAAVAAGQPFANVELAPVASPLVAGNYAPNIQTLTTNTPGAAIFSVDPLQPTFLQIADAGLYCLGVVWNMSNPVTLAVNSFITANQSSGSLTGSATFPIDELANTVATKRVQNLNGIAYTQFAGADSVRFIYHTGQSLSNVGPLGWTCWQVSPSITA